MPKLTSCLLLGLILLAMPASLGAVRSTPGCHEAVYTYGQDKIIVRADMIKRISEDERVIGYCRTKPYEVMDAVFLRLSRVVLAILGRPGEERGQRLAVFGLEPTIRLTWLDQDRGCRPWKICAGELDGDGITEICIGVWKKARFDPVYANRLQVFAWREGRLRPKWFGTRMAGPLLDFSLRDLDGDGRGELVTKERRRGGGTVMMRYEWGEFGFVEPRVMNSPLSSSLPRRNRGGPA